MRPSAVPGTLIQDPNEPATIHPSLGWSEFTARGVKHCRRDSVAVVYHLQRVIDVVEALPANARQRFDESIESTGGAALLSRRPLRRIAYRDFKYVLE